MACGALGERLCSWIGFGFAISQASPRTVGIRQPLLFTGPVRSIAHSALICEEVKVQFKLQCFSVRLSGPLFGDIEPNFNV